MLHLLQYVSIADFLRKFENETLNQKCSVYVKDDPGNIYQKESLHYRDNTRIAPVVVTAKELGVVMAKDNNATTTMTSIGELLKCKKMWQFIENRNIIL